MMADDLADLLDQSRGRPQALKDLPGHWRPLLVLIARGGTTKLAFRFLDPDIMEIGGEPGHCRVVVGRGLCLGGQEFADLLNPAGHPGGMADPAKILAEILLHLDGHPFLQQFLLAGQQLRRQLAETLAGIWAVRGAAEIHPGIQEIMAAAATLPGVVVLEEFHHRAALGTGALENRGPIPVAAVLSGALHSALLVTG